MHRYILVSAVVDFQQRIVFPRRLFFNNASSYPLGGCTFQRVVYPAVVVSQQCIVFPRRLFFNNASSSQFLGIVFNNASYPLGDCFSTMCRYPSAMGLFNALSYAGLLGCCTNQRIISCSVSSYLTFCSSRFCSLVGCLCQKFVVILVPLGG